MKQLPDYIRTDDPGSFARLTLEERLPEVIAGVVRTTRLPAVRVAGLRLLAAELIGGAVRSPFTEGPVQVGSKGAEAAGLEVEELAVWRSCFARCVGRPWLGLPWYQAEAMLYFWVLAQTGFFTDPYRFLKEAELDGEGLSLARAVLEGPQIDADLPSMLYLSLWGNRVDLSNRALTGEERGSLLLRNAGNLLIDHTDRAAARLWECRRVDVILDNAGSELVCDLLLVLHLSRSHPERRLILHAKRWPTFVSDAVVRDVEQTIAAMAAGPSLPVRAAGEELASLLDAGKIELRDHWFWNAPLHFPAMPDDLARELAESDVCLLKGDANYRRLISDRKWDPWVSMEEITEYFPCPFAVLRTMKSEIVVDTPRRLFDRLSAEDPQWMVSGRRGIVRYVRKGCNT